MSSLPSSSVFSSTAGSISDLASGPVFGSISNLSSTTASSLVTSSASSSISGLSCGLAVKLASGSRCVSPVSGLSSHLSCVSMIRSSLGSVNGSACSSV